MRKIIAMVISAVMILSLSTACFAAVPEFKQPSSNNLKGEVNIKLNLTGRDLDESTIETMKYIENINISYTGNIHKTGENIVQLYLDVKITAGIMSVPLKIWIDLNAEDLDNMTYTNPILKTLFNPFSVHDTMDCFWRQ